MRSINTPTTYEELRQAEQAVRQAESEVQACERALLAAKRCKSAAISHLSRIRRAAEKSGIA